MYARLGQKLVMNDRNFRHTVDTIGFITTEVVITYDQCFPHAIW